MIDDKIEDGDIGPLWAEHYPKRADRITSSALPDALVIADRAHSIYPHGDWSDKLQHALRFYGVSKEQYYEVGKDAVET
jgi:N-acetyl-beta-hexosaminidase